MWPSLLSTEECEKIIHYCKECYGVDPSVWHNYSLLKKKEGVWVVPHDHLKLWHQVQGSPDSFPEGLGLRLFSGKKFPYKITYAFFQLFSSHINKRVIEVSEAQALSLLKRSEVEDLDCEGLNYGYYIGVFKGRLIGIMLLGKEGWVSQVPKSLSGQLRKDLEISNK